MDTSIRPFPVAPKRLPDLTLRMKGSTQLGEDMQLLTIPSEKIKFLKERSADKRLLSVLLTVEPEGFNPGANRIRIKNRETELLKALEGEGVHRKLAQEWKNILSQIQDYRDLTNHHVQGLALLGPVDQPSEAVMFALFTECEDTVEIGAEYAISSVYPRSKFDRLYVLSLGANMCKLYERTKNGLVAVDLPEGCPTSVEETIRFEKEAGLDGNELYRNRGGVGGATHHGESPHDKMNEVFEERYFRKIIESLPECLEEGAQLALAGVEEKISKFEGLASELPLTEKHLTGSAEHLPLEILERKTEELLKELESEQRAKELEQLKTLPSDAKSTGWEKTMAAAREGRVEKLLLSNDSKSKMQRNLLASEVLQHGGTISMMLDKDALEEDIVGILRW